GLCDICHRRPAALRVTVSEDGRRRTLNVCREDYAHLRAQQASPFESLFGGSLFGDDLTSGFFGNGGAESRDAEEGAEAGGSPRRPGRRRESADVTDYLSSQAEEILQQAARTAGEWGAREVDSEHLLFALADNDVVQAILARFKLSPEDLKRQAREMAPQRQRRGERGEIGVSPRVKSALV